MSSAQQEENAWVRQEVAGRVFGVLLGQKPPSTFTEAGWRGEVEALARRAYEAADIFIRAGEGKFRASR